jgi:hypothetical protein
VYKSLTQDFIQKAQTMAHDKVVADIKLKVLQPMKDTLKEKVA